MPFKIIRADITKIQCDAIVNPTNEALYPGGGVDEAVHKAAGEALLAMCQELGGLDVGRAKITPAYNLPCKYIIHTVGPWWEGGVHNEKSLLQSCYAEALKIAKATKCESIAVPLISSGCYGYPKDQVLSVALEVIKEFLYENDMLVYIVVYDKAEYALSEQLQLGVTAYIDDNYDGIGRNCERELDRVFESRTRCLDVFDEGDCDYQMESGGMPWQMRRAPEFESGRGLERWIEKGFRETLIAFLDAKGISDVECYKRANVSRQTWHKIMTDASYKPTKRTAVALAISLCLDMDETQTLLCSAGFILTTSTLFDVIIMYCISKEIYDVSDVDMILFQYDQETLFSKE